MGGCRMGAVPILALLSTVLPLILYANSAETAASHGGLATHFDRCMNITTSGVYVASRDIRGLQAGRSYCLVVLADDVVIDGGGRRLVNNGGLGILVSGAENVTIRNLIIAGYDVALAVSGSSGVLLVNNSVSQFRSVGAIVRESRGVVLRGNAFSVSGDAVCGAVYFEKSDGGEIVENTITVAAEAAHTSRQSCSEHYVILVSGSTRNLIARNAITSRGVERSGVVLRGGSYMNLVDGNLITVQSIGILIQDSHDNVVSRNRVVGARVGVLASRTTRSTVIGNEIAMSSECGLMVDGFELGTIAVNNLSSNGVGASLVRCWGSVFAGNVVTGSGTVGVSILDSANNTIYNNIIAGSGYAGIHMKGSANNTIYNNVFNNSLNVIFEGDGPNSWSIPPREGRNIVGGPWVAGNAWLGPRGKGPSLQCEDEVEPVGICDEVFRVAENNVDYLPLRVETPLRPVDRPRTSMPTPMAEDIDFQLRLLSLVFFASLSFAFLEADRPPRSRPRRARPTGRPAGRTSRGGRS